MSEPTPQQPQYVPQGAQQAHPQQTQPVQPQYQTAPQQSPVRQQPVNRMKRVSILVAGLVVMAVFEVLGVLFLLGLLANVLGSASTAPSVDFAQVADKCGNRAAMMSGDDDSLSADITYYDGINGTEANEAYDCLVTEIDIPSSIVHKIDNTRTLDGTQSDTWDKTKITWSYSSSVDSYLDGGTLSMTFERVE